MLTRDMLGVTAATLAALAAPMAAAAQTSEAKAAVDAAKAAGIVGEQADGFLGFVTASADPALKAAVAQINAGRAALYREAAARTGATPAAAGASAFVNTVQPGLKPGQFYRPAGGGWTRR
jgi:uncharacterized protein YdbL (DUF1318 family)